MLIDRPRRLETSQSMFRKSLLETRPEQLLVTKTPPGAKTSRAPLFNFW
jgi:hypothetical protein